MNSENQTQLTFLDTQQSLKQNTVQYLYNLPYDVRRQFTNLLDADKTWRELGGRFIGLNETELELYSQATLRNESPTNTMLSKWEQSNVTIVDLYECLSVMKHLRAMSILKPYVKPSLHHLCDYKGLDIVLTAQNNNSKDNPNVNPSNHDKPQINLPSQRRDDEILQQNRRLMVDKPNHHFNVVQNDLRRELNDKCPLPNKNDKLNQLNVNHLSPIKPHHYNQPSQTPSQFKSSFSAVASTINAYDDNLPYQEILNATNNFHVSNVIGSGGFGIVYKGFWKGTKVAIKRLKDCDNFSQAITELRVLSQYRIDNIVPLYGISIGGNEPCLIYQFMINGSLDHRLQCKHNSQPLTWNQRINIGVGIAKALNYLHTRKGRPLIHGDVKSANILLDAQMQPKLGDFGLAKYLKDYQNHQSQQSTVLNPESRTSLGKNVTHVTVTSVHGTVAYLPPEYLRSKILSTAVDVYSYGIVLLEMLTGCRAFDGKLLLLDRVIDELEDAINKSSKNCQLLGEFGNLLSFKQKNVENELTIASIENNNKYASNCNCLSCKLYKLKDSKLPQNIESLFWYHCTMKLALDCCSKLKKKRPDSATILKNYDTFKDQFKQFTTCNQIFNLTGINTNRNSIASRVSSFKDDVIKTPLEHKLLNLSLSNRLDDVKESVESNSKAESNNAQNLDNQQSNQELVDNFELPLITELGVNILQPASSDDQNLI